MKSIQENPYRIIGVLANSTTKVIQSRKTKIQAFARVGKPVISEYDFSFLEPVRRDAASISNAFSRIEQNRDKVNNALSWFVNISPADGVALNHLAQGDQQKAFEIWEKLTGNLENISQKNYSAYNNIGTLCLVSEDTFDIQVGIEAKMKLIKSEYFKFFTGQVADTTYAVSNKQQAAMWIDGLSKELTKHHSGREIYSFFEACDDETKHYVAKNFTEGPIHKIETQLDEAKKGRLKDPGNAYETGSKLYKNSKESLYFVKSIFGVENLQYKMLADNVAKEILQCSIDYFNESQEQGKHNNYLEEAMKLAKVAESIAVNQTTNDKVKESIKTLEDMKDRELSEAIEVLKSVKTAYENNKAKINAEVVKMPLGYNQTINWTKVNQMIENSLNWDKVVALIKKTIPPQNVEKIKNINNSADLNEFKSLMEFLLKKLNFSQINQIKYICYWKTENTVSNIEFTTKSLPSWAKWCLGLALSLLVIGLIWGEEGLSVVFSIATVLGLLFLIGWLRTL